MSSAVSLTSASRYGTLIFPHYRLLCSISTFISADSSEA
jgi:hypothetical protein